MPEPAAMRASTTLASTTLALTFAAFALAACQTAGSGSAPAPAPAPQDYTVPGVTPSTFHLPTGTGCSGEVERFQAVMDNDLASGHTTKGVHGRVSAEIANARRTCAAGNESGAIGQIRSTKSKFGYPA